MPCEHLEWSASVGVGNITDEGGALLGRRTVEVRVQCAACGLPLEFQGLPIGADTHGPTISVDGLEARLVGIPKGDTLIASGRIAAIFRQPGGTA
jgi:hypothetical protein